MQALAEHKSSWKCQPRLSDLERHRRCQAEIRCKGRAPITGPFLDGTDGTREIVDTDGGRFDGHDEYDHVVGPMQFIPSTWLAYGVDANGGGIPDSHKAIDATWSAEAVSPRAGG